MNAAERRDLAYAEIIRQHFLETPEEKHENFKER
jgi:hypothetical protein